MVNRMVATALVLGLACLDLQWSYAQQANEPHCLNQPSQGQGPVEALAQLSTAAAAAPRPTRVHIRARGKGRGWRVSSGLVWFDGPVRPSTRDAALAHCRARGLRLPTVEECRQLAVELGAVMPSDKYAIPDLRNYHPELVFGSQGDKFIWTSDLIVFRHTPGADYGAFGYRGDSVASEVFLPSGAGFDYTPYPGWARTPARCVGN